MNPSPNQQGVRVSDDSGALCPYAAHIRRTNPRDDSAVKANTKVVDPVTKQPVINPPGSGQVEFVDIHRVLRRASPYGPKYVENEPLTVQRGLVGLFIGANLSQQFQFVMGQWISAGSFRSPDNSPNSSGVDPVFGPQDSDTSAGDHQLQFNEGDGSYNALPGLTRFIRTDGSLYIFMPGIAGLRFISEGVIPDITQ